jgi:hypothetical protein
VAQLQKSSNDTGLTQSLMLLTALRRASAATAKPAKVRKGGRRKSASKS